MDELMTLAKRIVDLDPYGFRNAETEPGKIIEEVADELKTITGAIDCIRYLLDYIDELEEV